MKSEKEILDQIKQLASYIDMYRANSSKTMIKNKIHLLLWVLEKRKYPHFTSLEEFGDQ